MATSGYQSDAPSEETSSSSSESESEVEVFDELGGVVNLEPNSRKMVSKVPLERRKGKRGERRKLCQKSKSFLIGASNKEPKGRIKKGKLFFLFHRQ